MFISLLVATFVIAFAVSWILARVFRKPVDRILARILADDISNAWLKYLLFAIYVVGISSGVRPWDLERYITSRSPDMEALVLNSDRWVLEIYRTIIGSLQGVAWMLLAFFLVALIVFAVIRIMELRQTAFERGANQPADS